MHLSLLLTFLLLTYPLADGNSQTPTPDQPSCLMPEHYPAIERQVQLSRQQLVEAGMLPENYNGRMAPPAFIWPVRQAAGFNYNSYYSINNFVDLDPAAGSVLDWNCGNRTYDGHRGIDINNWPFWWHMMDNDQVEAIAAADGIIIAKVDGNPDHNCSCIEPWNVIMIEHEDGYQSWYAHLKSGSMTTKGVGASVSAGEFLGVVGSAGCSSNPHLHFEVRDPDFNFVEPYVGACNNLATGSLWANQKPLRESTLNVLLTHSAPPNLPFCPEDEVTNFQNTFAPGQVSYFGAYFHDQEAGDVTSFQILDPDLSLYQSWMFTSPNTYNNSWWNWNFTLPENAKVGAWQFQATHNGEIVTHTFYVDCPQEAVINPVTISDDKEYRAVQTIRTEGDVIIESPGNVSMIAGQSITLAPGFSVLQGGIFSATTGECELPGARTSPVNGSVSSNSTLPKLPAPSLIPTNRPRLDVKISPNPAVNVLNLRYSGQQKGSPDVIELMDLNGTTIQRFHHHPQDEGPQNLQLSVNDLPAGIYFLRVYSGDRHDTQRVVLLSY